MCHSPRGAANATSATSFLYRDGATVAFNYFKAILSIASIMTNNQNVLENFGGVDANSLCQLLLNNNDDNDHPDDEPNIVQMSSYYDDDSLNNLFKEKEIHSVF